MSDGNGMSRLREDMAALAAERPPADLPPGVIGVTMFDQPGSEDGTVTVLLARSNVHLAPAQSLVRVVSRGDGRTYLGVVAAGPFALPDSLRPDSPVLVAVATNGADYLPPFHGRVQVTLLGEQLKDGTPTSTCSCPAASPSRMSPWHFSTFPDSASESTNTGLFGSGRSRGGTSVPSSTSSPRSVTCTRPWNGGR